ncbi:hypothetical protein HanIR_Chr10g0454201 [Helianthus annuus]|nr:hypothetical protein HanIR_Chr10g0454201 [Helianthus annuus]
MAPVFILNFNSCIIKNHVISNFRFNSNIHIFKSDFFFRTAYSNLTYMFITRTDNESDFGSSRPESVFYKWESGRQVSVQSWLRKGYEGRVKFLCRQESN